MKTAASPGGSNRGEPTVDHVTAAHRQLPHINTQGCIAADLRRRRQASYRSPVLDSGRSDPWYYDDASQPGEREVDGYADAARHLLECGLVPMVPAAVCREWWIRGGKHRQLAQQLHRHCGGEAAS